MRKALPLLVLLLPLALYLPHWGDFAAPFQMTESDLIGTHYPNAVFLQRALVEYGQIPLWSDTILGGYPFAANPLSGLWYPPGWLALVFDLTLGFNLAIGLHLLLGGLGMYRWLRDEGLECLPALLGGVSFELMPKLAGHYSGGHLTLLYALCWTPWLLWAEKQRAARGGVAPALVLGITLLASVPGAAYAGLLWALYSLKLAWPGLKTHVWKAAARWIGGFLGQTGLAALLAAPFLLLFLEYAGLSNRGLMTIADTLSFSLPPEQLLGLWLPNFGAFPEWAIYPGAFAFLVVCCSLVMPSLRKGQGFWLGILLFGILTGLGEHSPLTAWLFSLPGFSALRVPARLLFLSGFAFSVLAAGGVQKWQTAFSPAGRKEQRRIALALLLPVLLAALLLAAVWMSSAALPLEFAWGVAALALGSGLLWLHARQRIGRRAFNWLAVLLVAIDLGGVGVAQFNFRPAEAVFADGGSVPQILASAMQTEGSGRIYSPTLSISQQRAARLGLELAGGVDPMHLQSYLDYFSRASGIPASMYSVTLPPLPHQNNLPDYSRIVPEPSLLGRLNVAYVAAEYPLNAPGLVELTTSDGVYLYHNKDVRPRAWMQEEIAPSEHFWPVDSLQITPNRIEVRAQGPGILVLSENAYPGWEASVDGAGVEMLIVDNLLRGVRLAEGRHSIIFRFRPPWLAIGGALQVLAILVIIFYWIRKRNHV